MRMGPAPKWHLCFNSNQRFDETLARHAGFSYKNSFQISHNFPVKTVLEPPSEPVQVDSEIN